MSGARLLALDLDGTLLGSDGFVSRRTVAALEAARTAGWWIAIATGRPSVFAAPVVHQIGGAVTHVVAANGGEVLAANGTPLHRSTMPIAHAQNLVETIRSAIPATRFALVSDVEPTYEAGFELLMPVPMFPGRLVDDVLTVRGELVLRLSAFHDELGAHGLLAAIPPLLADPSLIAHAGIDAVDLLAEPTDKATGLAMLCSQLGLHAADVVAFGDNRNDHEMLEWAGLGVAMGNADESTQLVANEITLSNDDDGVAVVIERLLAR
jgi:hydroxymethylpyrimidine pyrophosphatase-like HAD family hydrolase